MADPWELICYHTYSGTPGVVYDLSLGGESPATAFNLADNDFLDDGATSGSGAVRFDVPGAALRVAANKRWQPLRAVRGEVTLLLEPVPAGAAQTVSRLIDAGSVQFDIRSGGLRAWFVSSPSGFAEVSTHLHGVTPNFALPVGRWITVGFHHDGVSVQELTLDGQVVARHEGPLWPVAAAGDVTIGNASAGGLPLRGLLDEVRVWRRNPRQIFDEFFERPMDLATARCWAEYLREFARWLREHPDCADTLIHAVDSAGNSMLRRALNNGAEIRELTVEAATQYRRLWSSGQLDNPEMAAVLADVDTGLQEAGVGPDTDPVVQSLIDSECLQQLRSAMPTLDCDPRFLAMSRTPRSRD